MFCRFWPSAGLVVLLSATPLFAQGWPVESEGPALPSPASSVEPPSQEVVPASPHLPPAQGGLAAHGPIIDATCGVEKNQGLFFQYDYLYWTLSAPSTSVIGDQGSEGWVTTPDGVTFYHENSLDTSWLSANYEPGHRFEFGYQRDSGGLLFSLFKINHSQSLTASGVDFIPQDPYGMLDGYADGNGDGIDDDLNGNQIYGRHGQDLGTPDGSTPPVYGAPFDGVVDTPAAVDTGDQVSWMVTDSTLQVSHSSSMNGFELMGLYDVSSMHPGSRFEWIYGVRYLQYKESFGLRGSGGFLDVTAVNTDTQNEIIGPQIGLRWQRQSGYVTFNAEARFAPAINFQRAEMVGHLATTQSPGGQNQPVSLNALGFNAMFDDTAFAPIGEFRVESICHINPWCGIRLGYSAMVAGVAVVAQST